MSQLPEHRNPPTTDEPSMNPVCCSARKISLTLLVAVAVVATCCAAYFAGRSSAGRSSAGRSSVAIDQAASDSLAQRWAQSLPVINASASATSEKFSMATGGVSDDAEGLFVLDHNSGLLQCRVIYPRRGQFMAQFTINVAEALGTGGKGGNYIMVTGEAEFPRASNRPAGSTVIYVMDSSTGNYAAYGVPFDHTAISRNQPQQGGMVLIGVGSANPLIDRDKLR